MKLQAALKKINARAKKVGVEVTITHQDENSHRHEVYVRFEGSNQTISFYANHSNRVTSGDIHLIKVTRDGDVSDPHTDYFAGSFVDNITQALNWIVPLPPKYRVGSLVRFKDNKRNGRWKLAGQVALVVVAGNGGNYQVKYPGQPERYGLTYSERDLELVN
jgi:hypothetical protein